MPEQISYRHELLRKAIHLCSLWMVVSLTTIPRTWNVILFGALLLILVAVEYGNHRKWRLFTATYGRFFGRLLRAQETGETFQLSGAPHVLAAALMCALLFEYRIAAIALSTMLIGDTGAALVGRKWGKHKINAGRKSVEGAATFWVCSFCVLLCFVWLYALPI
ncbi:MAG: phosphatidate cytidylyltransferase, partial [Burkholderiaceae bacterium]|nr:phosphatidate cytidylyltransferase [Burkholderiaceae bacterium]